MTKVRDIIEAATLPPWTIGKGTKTVRDETWRKATICRTHDRKWRYGDDASEEADALYIATFDPEHVALMEAVIDTCRVYDEIGLWKAMDALDAYRREHGLL